MSCLKKKQGNKKTYEKHKSPKTGVNEFLDVFLCSYKRMRCVNISAT